MWIPILRWCRISKDSVTLTAPVLFGRGFLFDGSTRVVTIHRRWLGITISEEKVPITQVVVMADHPRTSMGRLPDQTVHRVVMYFLGTNRTLIVCRASEDKTRRIVAAINQVR